MLDSTSTLMSEIEWTYTILKMRLMEQSVMQSCRPHPTNFLESDAMRSAAIHNRSEVLAIDPVCLCSIHQLPRFSILLV